MPDSRPGDGLGKPEAGGLIWHDPIAVVLGLLIDRDQALEVVGAADPDDVNEVARTQVREPDLDPVTCAGWNDNPLPALRAALVDHDAVCVAGQDPARDTADVCPDPVGYSGARWEQPDDGFIPPPER